MVPMVYPTTMKVEPVINVLNQEHEEIKKIAQGNLIVKFAEHTANYYDKKMKSVRSDFQKQIKGSRSKQDPESLTTTDLSESVINRMKSDHLNSFMQ